MEGAAICQSASKANTPQRSRRERKIVNESCQNVVVLRRIKLLLETV